MCCVVTRNEQCGTCDITYRFVHHNECGRAEAGLSLDQAVKVHQHFRAHALGDEGCRGAAGDYTQQVVPAAAHSTYRTDVRFNEVTKTASTWVALMLSCLNLLRP